ncbi:UDP-N-acetylmuramate--L-alanine ligase [Buchnera aphidicola]|uniref:UDP-N-acetylmuramate--L-alanine ligase n=1 Tax=Buchnera aphidicola TaxID=9 RepID=UPI003CE4912A
MNIKKINFFKTNKTKKNIHFIGISGSGMSGIALILLQLGYKISGSDLLKNNMTEQLINLGAKIYFQHAEKNIQNVDIIVRSSAIKSNNIEIISAKKNNIPILSRANLLSMLMQFKYGIAISGTHGKTTTTSMISDIFIETGLDPTIVNGGLIKSINSHAKLGNSNYLIAEADESDGSFLLLNPKIVIVTNIESDHMDYYNHNFIKLKKAFLTFLNKIPLYSIAILCIDNDAIHSILPHVKCKLLTYGFNQNADIRICDYTQTQFVSTFQLIIKNQTILNITLNMPGKHNILNATAAIALAIHENINNENIIKSLKNFQGTCRRFEFLGKYLINKNIDNNSAIFIDDYGHHPTELSENIKTIRMSWPNKNLIMIFQPHRYTRTHNLYNDFIKILCQVDFLLILHVYPANEKYIFGADSFALYNDIKKLKKNDITLINDNNIILDTIMSKLSGNDIILIQGAGDINQIIHQKLIQKIKKVII